MRVVATAQTPRPEVQLLSNGRYSVMVSNSGGGYSRWQGLALTRWREDPTCDSWGSFCYVRDVESGEWWSSAYQPSQVEASHYEAIFPLARAEFRRRDRDIEMHTEITVSPEDDIELRRFVLTNLSAKRRVLEFTSYAEVVLAQQSADEAHQSFSNLFVQTEILPGKQAILCTRRPRSDQDATPTMLHSVTPYDSVQGEVSFETARGHFIGRGRSPANPLAMEAAAGSDGGAQLGGNQGSVLDPIVATRCRIVLEPDQTIKLHLVTGVAENRESALRLVDKYHDRHIADRVFELAWTHAQVVLRQLNISETDVQLYIRLASTLLYTNLSLRASRTVLTQNRRGQSDLWGYGVSGDLPIVLLRIADLERLEIVRQLIQAHGYWRMMGLSAELVIWCEDESGYRQVLQEQVLALIAAGGASALVDKAGGIFVRRSDQMPEEDQILFQTVARAIIKASSGTLAEQLDRRGPAAAGADAATDAHDAHNDKYSVQPGKRSGAGNLVGTLRQRGGGRGGSFRSGGSRRSSVD